MVTVTLLVSACHRYPEPPAESYQRWTDQMIVRLGLRHLHIYPCASSSRVDECYKMQPPRRWRGVWMTYFEANRFCPGARYCSREKTPRFDLVWTRQALRDRAPLHLKTGSIYAVDFIGRRAEYPVSTLKRAYPIVVDRLISVEEKPGGSDGFEKEEFALRGE